MATKRCPKCGCAIIIEVQYDINGDFPIGRCSDCGHCFMDYADRQRIRLRLASHIFVGF